MAKKLNSDTRFLADVFGWFNESYNSVVNFGADAINYFSGIDTSNVTDIIEQHRKDIDMSEQAVIDSYFSEFDDFTELLDDVVINTYKGVKGGLKSLNTIADGVGRVNDFSNYVIPIAVALGLYFYFK